MFEVPRLFFKPEGTLTSDVLAKVESSCMKRKLGIFLQTRFLLEANRLKIAQRVKELCLHCGDVLVVDDLEVAAKVNADGLLFEVDATDQGRARNLLGSDKLIGTVAHSIEQVADVFEDDLSDYIVLESLFESSDSTNLLGRQRAQQIIDDSRIMGYDIPILLSGGIDGQNAAEANLPGTYGLVTSDLDNLDAIYEEILRGPLR